jgi:O-acetyl-ADP-ribose deacetylase (regulator of RNase III)
MIKIIHGDITAARVDAIVNAANKTLLGGGGVDGAIHLAAGHSILLECQQIPAINGIRCETGHAVVTSAGELQARYVIHTVGPIYDPHDCQDEKLACCYENCLKAAIELGCKSIAFPEISTGVYKFPKEKARKIAATVCDKYKDAIDILLYRF